MKKRELITFIIMTALLAVVVLVGNPLGREDTGVIGVLADAPTSTPTATPTATVTPTPKVTATPAPTATPTPEVPPVLCNIVSLYDGEAVVVGDKYDKSKLKVYAYWTDGSSELLELSECDISGERVEKEGYNKFVVIYKGMTDYFGVYGKMLKSISVSTTKYVYGLLNGIDERDVTVTGFYSNGSTDEIKSGYAVSPASFTTSGTQEVTFTYRGCKTTLPVFVNEAKNVKNLSVTYNGSNPVQDQEISRSDITVTAVYDDAGFTTERITTYQLLQSSFPNEGENTLTVAYLGKTASCKINVEARKIVEMTAEYTGEPVEIGQVYPSGDLHVYLKYNDDLKVETNEYSVYDPVIRYLGENIIKIYYGDYNTSVKITGIEVLPPDFSYVSEFTIRSGSNSFTITTALPKRLDKDSIAGKLVKKTKLTKAFRRLNSKKGWYCGFGYDFTDSEYETYLPVTVRITLPKDMEPEYTEIYYTPNLKSIVAKMNKTVYNRNTIEMTIFKVGSYMIVYDPDAYVEEEVEEDTLEE